MRKKLLYKFNRQMDWIAENKKRYDIQYVLHLGDVTQNNNEAQWEMARKAFKRLNGKTPYAIAVGNHDVGLLGTADNRSTLLNKYFPVKNYKKWKTFGGVFEGEPKRGENCYHTFSVNKTKWLILVLEFGPRDKIFKWANKVVEKHSQYNVVLVTHAYMDQFGVLYKKMTNGLETSPPHRYGIKNDKEGLNDGEDIWKKLVSKHKNIKIVICGHTPPDGLAYVVSKGESGNKVHQMVVNYQHIDDGTLRLLQFDKKGKTVEVHDYSPVTGKINDQKDSRLTFKLD
ncbi:metallophosphoesterase [Lentisphaerota bacterium]|nr:metallophosphoesterase [Lentisphaerota bacterium]